MRAFKLIKWLFSIYNHVQWSNLLLLIPRLYWSLLSILPYYLCRFASLIIGKYIFPQLTVSSSEKRSKELVFGALLKINAGGIVTLIFVFSGYLNWLLVLGSHPYFSDSFGAFLCFFYLSIDSFLFSNFSLLKRLQRDIHIHKVAKKFVWFIFLQGCWWTVCLIKLVLPFPGYPTLFHPLFRYRR